MNDEMIIWLFPIVFMIHEFEEIIFIRWWVARHKEHVCKKYPGWGQRMIRQYESLSTEGFALIVAQEFLIVSAIVILSVMTGRPEIFIGLIIAYSLHLLVHLIQTAMLATYTPAIVTAVLTGIYSVYAIVRFVQSGRLNGALTLILTLFLSLVVVVNLQIMHRLVRRLAFLKDLSAPCSCSTESTANPSCES